VLDKNFRHGNQNHPGIRFQRGQKGHHRHLESGEDYYETPTKKSRYGLPPDETPALTARLQAVASQVEAALPSIWH